MRRIDVDRLLRRALRLGEMLQMAFPVDQELLGVLAPTEN